MVERPLIVKTVSHWFPTKTSAERYALMRAEFSVNHYPPAGGPSVAEIAWSSGSVEQALAKIPVLVPEHMQEVYRPLFHAWPQGRHTTAYQRSGGILNLFTPPWGEQEDEVWASMLEEWQQQRFADEQAQRESLRALERQWNRTRHPFFAGLTPAQVMIGGGRQEAELAEEFLEHLTEEYDGRPFPSEGEALRQTLMLLRGWQIQPRDGGRTPQQIILAERDDLLARRDRILSQSTDD